MNHTPGQWTTQTYSPGVDQDGDPFENQIRVITRTCEVASGIQCEHDARLIAAAPELLNACIEALKHVSVEEPAYHTLHAAIDKALK